MTLRAVLFDWGGVIQRTFSAAPRRALDGELGLAPGAVERAGFESEVWRQASSGLCGGDDAWAAIAASLGWPAERLDELVTRFFSGDRVDALLVAAVAQLRRAGYRVGLLSNAPPPRERAGSEAAAGRWGRADLFDAQVFSYQVGALKPAACTYAAALAALGAAPGETLFVDDAPANVAAALDLGLDAVRFTTPADRRREFARRGLPWPAVEERVQ
jgi:putative hydrolase of the HAD superfamily